MYASPDELLLSNSRAVLNDGDTCGTNSGINQGCNDDCTGLQMCIQGELYTIDCEAQTGRPYCDTETKECVSTPVLCPSSSKKFECPGYGIFPDPLDCTQFHICDYGVDLSRRCINSVFSPYPPTCDLNSTCYTFSTASYGLCNGKIGKIIGHPRHPQLFVQCNANYPILRTCEGENVEFDSVSVSCQYKCPGIGLFPHVDPSLYYLCTKDAAGRYTAAVKKCPDDEIFCSCLKTCMKPFYSLNFCN